MASSEAKPTLASRFGQLDTVVSDADIIANCILVDSTDEEGEDQVRGRVGRGEVE